MLEEVCHCQCLNKIQKIANSSEPFLVTNTSDSMLQGECCIHFSSKDRNMREDGDDVSKTTAATKATALSARPQQQQQSKMKASNRGVVMIQAMHLLAHETVFASMDK